MLNEILNKRLKKQQPLKSKESPYKGKQIKTIRFMRANCNLIIWGTLATLGYLLIGSNWFLWLIGLFIAKYVAQFLVIFGLWCLFYILIYALISGGLFWILIS